MIQTLCCKLTALWCRLNIISDDDAEVYKYGLELLISTAMNFFVIVLLSFWMKKPLLWIPYLMTFVPCRIFGGGYHSKTHLGCTLFTAGLYLTVNLCADLVPKEWTSNTCILGSILSLALLLLFAPIAADNKPLTAEERKRYRKITLVLGAIILCSTLIYRMGLPFVSERTMLGVVSGEIAMVVSMIIGNLSSVIKNQRRLGSKD